MRQVKPTGDFLVPVIYSGHEAHAKVSDFAKGAGLAQLATDAGGASFSPLLQGAILPPPSSFSLDMKLNFPFHVRYQNGRFSTNFDRKVWAPTPDVQPWLTQNTYYVDGTAGNDANSGATWALAFKSIGKAIRAGNVAAAPYVVYVRAGTYDRTLGWTSQAYQAAGGSGIAAPSQPSAFIAVGGRVVSTMCGTLSWALNSGTTYQVARSNARRVLDIGQVDLFGDWPEITSVASLAACQATPGTYYTDNVTLYVNRADGAAVSDSNTRVLLSTISHGEMTTSGNLYVSGFDFEGGDQGCVRLQNSAATGRVVYEDCTFKYSSGPTPMDCVQLLSTYGAAFVRCAAARSVKDGFNQHRSGGVYPVMITIDCVGRHNGMAGSTSNNGLTGHDGCLAIDVAGVYHHNAGGNVAFVHTNTQLWAVGTSAHDSLGDVIYGGLVPPCDFQADQGAATIFADYCSAFASQYSEYIGSGGSIVKRGCGFNSNTYTN